MPGGGDPRCPVYVEPDVAVVGPERLPCVQPHPHPHRAARERELRVRGGHHCIGCARKGDEERIALCVDLDPLVPPPRLPQRTAVLGKHTRIPVAQLPEQARRPFYVGEEERHRPGRELRPHPSILSRPEPRHHPRELSIPVTEDRLCEHARPWVVRERRPTDPVDEQRLLTKLAILNHHPRFGRFAVALDEHVTS